jgi:hypothetical protein
MAAVGAEVRGHHWLGGKQFAGVLGLVAGKGTQRFGRFHVAGNDLTLNYLDLSFEVLYFLG